VTAPSIDTTTGLYNLTLRQLFVLSISEPTMSLQARYIPPITNRFACAMATTPSSRSHMSTVSPTQGPTQTAESSGTIG
jgi:hypothetical protein